MVRPDHEAGGVLNSEDDAEPQSRTSEPQVVRRSSPLGRRKKPKAANPEAAVPVADGEGPAESTADAAADADVEAPQVAESDAAASESDATETDAGAGAQVDDESVAGGSAAGDEQDAPADVEPDADELARNTEYRERRRQRAVVRRSGARGESGDRSTLTIVAVAVTGLLVVACVILSAVFGVQYYKIQQDRELRAEYTTFAQQMVTSMFTLNPDNADQMYKNVMDNSSGRAKQMFEENMKKTAEMIRKGDMVTKTTVLADAVSEASQNEGSVLIVLDWQGHPKNDKKATQSASFRLRVDMTRINGDLKMTYLDWVA